MPGRATQRESQQYAFFAGSLWQRADLLSFRRATICFGHVFSRKNYLCGVLGGMRSARFDLFGSQTAMHGANSIIVPHHSFAGPNSRSAEGPSETLTRARRSCSNGNESSELRSAPKPKPPRVHDTSENVSNERKYVPVSARTRYRGQRKPVRILVRGLALSVAI